MADGYHRIETRFAFTEFGDRLLASPAPEWSLAVVGPTADGAGPLEQNLVLRAARAFAEATGAGARYAFRLEKHVPVAAGLGGGSADAGAALRLLNRAAGFPVSAQALEAIGAGLGADVAACVRSASCIGTGRGEQLLPAASVAGIHLLLVNPRVPVPTGPVFHGWDGIDRGALGADFAAGRNDLEAPAIRLQPVIGDVLDWLSTLPAVRLVRMSGSGATCFALFDTPPTVDIPEGWWGVATRLI